MQQVKGSVLKSRMTFVEEQGGSAAAQRVLAELTPDEQQQLKTLLTMKWYPFDEVVSLRAVQAPRRRATRGHSGPGEPAGASAPPCRQGTQAQAPRHEGKTLTGF